MKTTMQVLIAVAFAAVAAARPYVSTLNPREELQQVHVFAANVSGENRAGFPTAPSNLSGEQQAFLKKYQPLSEKALAKVQPVRQGRFSSAGFCFSEFPCLSVNKAGVASIGKKEEVEREQISAILDELTSSNSVTFGNLPNSILNGLRISKKGAVLDVIAPTGSMESQVLAGMVFDMYKLQSDDVTTNSIRATQAQTDGKESPLVAMCVYPEGVDTEQVYNFCIGKELDGSPINSGNEVARRAEHVKRGFRDMICSIVDLPLIC